MLEALGLLNQSSEHAPGPRGSPQLPHGPGEVIRIGSPLVCAANTDSFRSSAVPWQAGHAGVSLDRTSVSNSFAHVLQAYS